MDFAGRPPQFYRAKFMADGHKDIVSASPCSLWLLLKKAVHREVRKYDPSILRLEELTFEVIDDLLEELENSKEKTFNPREALFNGIVNTNCLLLIGEKLNKDDEKIAMMKKLISLVTRAMCMGGRGSELDQFPWLRFFGNSTYKELILAKKLRDEIYDWMKKKVDYDLKESNLSIRCSYFIIVIYFSDTGVFGVVHAFQKLTEAPNEKVDAINVKLAIVNLIIGIVFIENL